MRFVSLRRAARSLRQGPASTLAALVTLSLGVAAATALFTLVHAVLLRPLPLAEPDRLLGLRGVDRNGRETGLSWQDVRDLAAGTRSLESAAAFRNRTWGLTDDSGAPLEVVLSAMVTRDFFRTLGVRPERGQDFAAGWERTGANHVLWLSHDLWLRRFGGNAAVVGRSVALNDEPYRVVGVLPASFRLPLEGAVPQVYIPLNETDYCCQRDGRSLGAVARLASGASASEARNELAVVSRQLAQAWPQTNRGVTFTTEGLQAYLAGDRRGPLLLLFGATGVLLLLACLNAGAILLARALRRVREYAVKASLGATARDLLGEQLAQGLLLGALAAMGGIGGAWLLLRWAARDALLGDALSQYARYGLVEVDARVATFGAILSLLAALAAALAPAVVLRRASLEQTLRAGMPAGSRSAARTRAGLVTAQVALSVVLLTAGALLLRGLHQTLTAERGYRTEGVHLAAIGIPEARYDTDAKMIAFHEQVIERLQAIPGVSRAAGGVGLPAGGLRTRFLRDGETIPERERPRVAVAVASPQAFDLLDIPVLRGRAFGEEDRGSQPLVAVVNQSFAARHLAGRDPIGARLRIGFYNGQMKPWSEVEIVGVVGDTRNRGLLTAVEPGLYLSSLQVPSEGFSYLVRTSRPAEGLTREFQEAVWSVDRNVQVVRPRPLAQHVEAALDSQRLALRLLGGTATLALVLATAGLGASVAAGVTERTREFGVRAALGATPARLQRTVVASALRVVASGLLLGMAGALGTLRWLRSLLPQITLADPLLLVVLALLLVAIGVIAAAVPAWRAGRVDPLSALRREG